MTAIDQKSFKSTKKTVDSDTKVEEVATESITKELRELPLYSSVKAATTDTIELIEPLVYVTMADLDAIADRIDAEHERRMDGAVEVIRCRDCQWARRMDDRFVCTVRPTMAHLVDDSDYCSRGVRAEVDE